VRIIVPQPHVNWIYRNLSTDETYIARYVYMLLVNGFADSTEEIISKLNSHNWLGVSRDADYTLVLERIVSRMVSEYQSTELVGLVNSKVVDICLLPPTALILTTKD
jgi:hypothetical protein